MDYMEWSKRMADAGDVSEVLEANPAETRKFLPQYIQERLDECKGLRQVTLWTSDYQAHFHEDRSGEFHPKLRISSRIFHIIPERYEGTVKELSEYAARKLSRKGISRFVLNTLPDLLSEGLIKSDDFWHDLFHPITSRASRWFDEAFD